LLQRWPRFPWDLWWQSHTGSKNRCYPLFHGPSENHRFPEATSRNNTFNANSLRAPTSLIRIRHWVPLAMPVIFCPDLVLRHRRQLLRVRWRRCCSVSFDDRRAAVVLVVAGCRTRSASGVFPPRRRLVPLAMPVLFCPDLAELHQ